MPIRPPRALDPTLHEAAYSPFPNVPFRNVLQRRIEIPLLVRALALPRGGRVLEVGCGRGVAVPALARLLDPSRLVGIDVERGFLREFTRSEDSILARVAQADVRSLPFPDGAFDLVVDFGTAHHVARADLALQEVARVLAPGGVFATETRWAQRLSHPIRTRGRRLRVPPELEPRRAAGLWASHTRIGPPPGGRATA